jgi:serine/threonine-protein kinase
MVTTELGACEWFVWDLRRSNLLDRGQLDQVVGEFLEKNATAEPPALAEYLVNRGILTQFQAERLLQGKTQGFVLGPFTLQDAIGSGSMGTVYKAQSKTDNQWYAVKVLPRRSMWNVRIARRKVRLFEQCKHPAVVPFVDVGTAGSMHYLAWPLVEGETLDKVVERSGKLEPNLAARFILQAAQGLQACHAVNLFHGTLKPSNLMVGTDGNVRVLDFGIGSLLAETDGESLVDTMSTANSVSSGLDCASPESVMDPTNLTPHGDQYSLGCIFYYCLTGTYPFPDGSAAEKMMAHQFKEPKSVRELAPEVSDQLSIIVERLMQKSPQARYPNIAHLVSDLEPFVSQFAGIMPQSLRRTEPMAEAAPVAVAAAAVQVATPPPMEDLPPPRGSEYNMRLPSRESLRSGRQTPPPNSNRGERNPTPVKSSGSTSDSFPELFEEKEPEPEPVKRYPRKVAPTQPGRSLDERLGTIGMVLVAVVMCAAAWFISWRFLHH